MPKIAVVVLVLTSLAAVILLAANLALLVEIRDDTDAAADAVLLREGVFPDGIWLAVHSTKQPIVRDGVLYHTAPAERPAAPRQAAAPTTTQPAPTTTRQATTTTRRTTTTTAQRGSRDQCLRLLDDLGSASSRGSQASDDLVLAALLEDVSGVQSAYNAMGRAVNDARSNYDRMQRLDCGRFVDSATWSGLGSGVRSAESAWAEMQSACRQEMAAFGVRC